MTALAVMVLACAGAIAAGWQRPAAAIPAAAAAAVVSMAASVALWLGPAGPIVDLPWIPSLNSRLVLEPDALGAPLAVFVTGIAVPILVFAARYLPDHLEEQGRDGSAPTAFASLMLGFMLAMVLLVLARDLIVLFLALELTALASFFLIRYDRHLPEARAAARVALVVTGASSLLFLAGALIVARASGTTALPDLTGVGGETTAAAAICLIAGVLAKSAQVPLHFWLPRAMAAPTPVSAYLHSATLVAAGAFVLMRLRPLLATAPGVLEGLFWFAFLSVFTGAALALVSDRLKHVLAYSTIAQYGYAIALVAAGGEHGAAGAVFFLVAHGLAKAALFLTAGAITSTTGIDRLSQAGGLARRMPVLAASSAVAALGLAGLPPTIGFFKDDLLIRTGLAHAPGAGFLAAAAVATTLAYTARFWAGLFLGAPRSGAAKTAEPAARVLTAPVALLAGLLLAGALMPGMLKPVFAAAGSVVAGEPVPIHLAWPTELDAATILTLGAWVIGLVLVGARRPIVRALAAAVGRAAPAIGAAAWAARIGGAAEAASDRLLDMELGRMRERLSAILLPTAVLVGLGMWSHGRWPTTGTLETKDIGLVAGLGVVAIAALAAARHTPHLTFVLVLSFLGFGLAAVFALAGAPDVALVVALVETGFTLLFVSLIGRVRERTMARARHRLTRDRGPGIGIGAGIVGFAVAWLAFSAPIDDRVAEADVALSSLIEVHDVVGAILADFRGLDTAVEVTVLIAAL